ncbi:hypothetical protein QGN23_12665 [Chryseobacterium gotjawalense]|uniref:Lipoprotein n=1 Tax=Chryseobacterium gotjawalense TaxID=3042315 RepID=A0ABY8RC65_9FLAO|nr:hypothetical protein [Chryseobacterium sp. wdc7]WHF51274.1 hypothetical protein QGN23_12665 [Chryseobacterium sp. wdc7]
MKLKIICTLTVLIGLCMISCREHEEINESFSTKENEIMSRTAKDAASKKDSLSSFDDETKDPPVKGTGWKIKP